MKDYVPLDYAAGVFIMAKWPCLVLSQFCKTHIDVIVEDEELNENGTSKVLLNWSGECNYQDKAKRIWNKDKVLVDITGSCLIPGDIAPDMAVIPQGKVKIFEEYRILETGTKARNPDGSVNYTRLELR